MRLIAEYDVARLLGVDRATLRRWRTTSRGPSFIRLGPRLIRYKDDDIEEFLNSQRNSRRDASGVNSSN